MPEGPDDVVPAPDVVPDPVIAPAPADAPTEVLAAIVVEPDPVSVVEPVAMRRRRRRWPWVVLVSVLVGIVVVAAGGLWYISGLIGAGTQLARPSDPFPMAIAESVDPGSVSYRGPLGGWVDQGLMGIATVEGGYVQTDEPIASGSGQGATTTRHIVAPVLPPEPGAGQAASLDGWYYPRNPLVGLGIDYQDVVIDGPHGATPAWLLPGSADTWVIFTHGRGATPLEGLRIANTASRMGYPMLLIKYLGDAKAPQGNGYGQFGVQEWPDLEAAVQYALDNGAQQVVLTGASMGGAITLAFLQNSALADRVVGAFLDAPVADFGQVVEANAVEMGLPPFVTTMGMWVAAWRYGFDWTAMDYTSGAAGFTTPMIIVQGTADETIPAIVNEDFAAAAEPGVVRLELFDGAAHVMSWNLEHTRYQQLLSGFLTDVAPLR